MYILITLVLVLVIVLGLFYFKCIKIKKVPKIYRNYTRDTLTPQQIIKEFPKDIVVSEYDLDSFYSSNEIKSTWKDLFNKKFEIKDNKKYQVKTIIKQNNPNIVYKKLRVSMTPWSFPKHFDPYDQLLIVLDGNREILVEDELFKLNAGDAVFIPMGNNHTVTTNNDFPFSILMTCAFKVQECDLDLHNYYVNKFKENWPKQSDINNTGWY
jgi:quercetin dioxygenase-like cupin family protein